MCRPLRRALCTSGRTFDLGYPVTHIAWPRCASAAAAAGLAASPPGGGCVSLQSMCGSARLVVEYAGLRFAVRYPLLLGRGRNSGSGDYDAQQENSSDCMQWSHTWHTQVFSRASCPRRWRHALSVAVELARDAIAGRWPSINGEAAQQQQQQQQDLQHRPQQGVAGWNEPGSPPHNHLRMSCASSAAVCVGSPTLGAAAAGTAGNATLTDARNVSSSSSPLRLASPVQRQHASWRTPAAAPGTVDAPGLIAADATGLTDAHVTHLPLLPELLPLLPDSLALQALQSGGVQQQPAAAAAGAGAASSLGAALAQSLGARRGIPSSGAGVGSVVSSAAAGAGLGRGWWLEPSLLLPSDELVALMWSRDATTLFIRVCV
jgi:hypothetical protein